MYRASVNLPDVISKNGIIKNENIEVGCYPLKCNHKDECKGKYRSYCIRELLEADYIKKEEV